MANAFSTSRHSVGFSSQIAGAAAERQLRMSFAVVVTLAIAIVSAAATVGRHPIDAERPTLASAPAATFHADTNAVGAARI